MNHIFLNKMNPKINFPIDIIKYHILPNCDRLCDLIRWRIVSRQFKKRIDEILYKEEPVLLLKYLKFDISDFHNYHIIYNAKQFTRNNNLVVFDPIDSCHFMQFNNLKKFLFYSELQTCNVIINKYINVHLYEGVLEFCTNIFSIAIKHCINLKNNISQKYHFLKLIIKVKQLQEKKYKIRSKN